jgi:His/Glu/Gln/Arg/opine family amino acid ABC transporter permease subunit
MNLYSSLVRFRYVLILVVFSIWVSLEPSWRELWAARIFFLNGVLTTALYSVLGVAFGLLLGGLLAGMRLYGGVLGVVSATVVTATQAVPPLFIITGVYFVSPEVLPFKITPAASAVTALTLVASSYYCEAMRGAIAGVEKIQVEAAKITGLSRRIIFSKIVMPQALVASVPAIGAISIVVFKLSTLLFPLGITDFFRTTVLVNNRVIAPLECYALIAIFYYVASDALQYWVQQLARQVSR